MITELNEILNYLKQNEKSAARNRTRLALRLQLMIPSNRLEAMIKQLSKDGQIHIFLHQEGLNEDASKISRDKNISFALSSRGKHFLRRGGYRGEINIIETPNQLRA